MIPPDVIATGRYQTWQPGDGVPVRTTVGPPRFWRGPQLVFLSAVPPCGVFKNDQLTTTEDRVPAYRARLDSRAGLVLDRLTELGAEHRGERLVLLCYDDVAAGQECHRRWFAAWFEERFGIEVPEIHEVPPISDRSAVTTIA